MVTKKKKPGRKRIGNSQMMAIRMPFELLEMVDEYAQEENLSDRATTIRKIIGDHLKKCRAEV